MSETKKDTKASRKVPTDPTAKVKKVTKATPVVDPNERANKIIHKLGTRIDRVVLSPRRVDGSVKEWKRYRWSASFLRELKTGKYGLRFLDKNGMYLATVLYTKK